MVWNLKRPAKAEPNRAVANAALEEHGTAEGGYGHTKKDLS